MVEVEAQESLISLSTFRGKFQVTFTPNRTHNSVEFLLNEQYHEDSKHKLSFHLALGSHWSVKHFFGNASNALR